MLAYGLQSRKIASFLAVAVFSVIALIPLGLMFTKAFSINDTFSVLKFESLLSARQAALFFRSSALAIGTTLLSLAAGIPMAFFIHRTRTVGHRALKYLFLFPLTVPPQVFVTAWLTLSLMCGFTDRNDTSFIAEALSEIPTAAFLLALAYYPLIVITTLAGLGSLDQRMEDAATLVHGRFSVLRRITLPLLSPYIITGAVFVFLFSMFNYGVPALLRIQTYPVEIFAQFSAFYDEGRATILSCPLILTAICLLGLVKKKMGLRAFFTISTNSVSSKEVGFNISGILLAVWSWAIILGSVIVPLGVLLFQAASLGVILAVLKTSSQEIATTLVLSATAATLLTVIAYPLSERISTDNGRFWSFMDFVTLLPFAVPATVLGIGIIYLWNQPLLEKVYGSAAIVVIAFTARFVPFAIRAVTAGFGQVDPSLWEAAMLFERSGFRRWLRIEWPLLRRSIAVGWLIGFIFCMNELGTTLLIIPPGYGTLLLKIYNLMHYGANQMVAGMSLLLVAINLFSAGIISKLFIMRRAS